MLELEQIFSEEGGARRRGVGGARQIQGIEGLVERGQGLEGTVEGEWRRGSAEEAVELGGGEDWGEGGDEEPESEERGGERRESEDRLDRGTDLGKVIRVRVSEERMEVDEEDDSLGRRSKSEIH